MENEEPSYYAVIPADVRYSDKLTPNAKLLYGEISALSNKYGYCFAGNKYFSDLYKVTKAAVSGWIKQLEKAGFITTEIIRKENNEVEQRKIHLLNLPKIIEAPSSKYFDHPTQKKLKDNTTRVNTTSGNSFKKPSKEEIADYCKDKGYDLDIDYFYDYWESVGWCRGKTKMKDWKATLRNWVSRDNSKPKKKKSGFNPLGESMREYMDRCEKMPIEEIF